MIKDTRRRESVTPEQVEVEAHPLTIHTSCFGGLPGPGGSQLKGNWSLLGFFESIGGDNPQLGASSCLSMMPAIYCFRTGTESGWSLAVARCSQRCARLPKSPPLKSCLAGNGRLRGSGNKFAGSDLWSSTGRLHVRKGSDHPRSESRQTMVGPAGTYVHTPYHIGYIRTVTYHNFTAGVTDRFVCISYYKFSRAIPEHDACVKLKIIQLEDAAILQRASLWLAGTLAGKDWCQLQAPGSEASTSARPGRVS